MSRKRTYYDAEFKRAVVSGVITEGRSRAEVARQYNLPNPQIVSRWVGDVRKGIGWARSEQEMDMQQKYHELEKENKRLRQEVEILKTKRNRSIAAFYTINPCDGFIEIKAAAKRRGRNFHDPVRQGRFSF